MCRMIEGVKRGCGKNAHSYNNKPTTPLLCKTDMPLSLMFEYYPESLLAFGWMTRLMIAAAVVAQL